MARIARCVHQTSKGQGDRQVPWRDLDPDEVTWMRPKKWGEFQHYHDGRKVHWIKNWLSLDEPGSKFSKLSWADQGRLQALFRLAARLDRDGMIPYDERYIRSALGDKRFTLVSHLVTNWFHVGTQKELKRAAKREIPSRDLSQNSRLEVRGKKKETPYPPSGRKPKALTVVPDSVCPECHIGGGAHVVECSRRVA